ncbi:MAG: sugar ABC transporter permease [Chloroflexi bacterium]|nr:sugar ABC transporter permease [Chloroflexota bacterium]
MQSISTAISGSASVNRRRSVHLRRERTFTIILFLLPAAALYSLLVIFPVLQAAYYGFYKWNGLGPATNFVGMDNYLRILRDEIFQQALWHNIVLIVLSLVTQLPLALACAILVGRHLRGRSFFRMIYFLPFVLSEVVAGLIWSFIYHPRAGLLNWLLKLVFPAWEPPSWLGTPNLLVLFCIFVVITWKYFGYHMILYVAGLQNIPAEVEEAAQIDGASSWQVIRYIIIPLLGRTIRLTVYLSVLGSLQLFDLVWIMTQGGPANSSNTMATYMYQFGFLRSQLGYGSSIALIMFIICFSFSLIYQRKVMHQDFAV